MRVANQGNGLDINPITQPYTNKVGQDRGIERPEPGTPYSGCQPEQDKTQPDRVTADARQRSQQRGERADDDAIDRDQNQQCVDGLHLLPDARQQAIAHAGSKSGIAVQFRLQRFVLQRRSDNHQDGRGHAKHDRRP